MKMHETCKINDLMLNSDDETNDSRLNAEGNAGFSDVELKRKLKILCSI